MGKVEHSWELRAPRGDRNTFRSTLRWARAPHAVTAIHFGLPSAGRGRLARHGRHRRWSTHL